MTQNALDEKLNDVFTGKVVRKDLLLQVKKGTNVPSFVLEFLLARYCASDDPREIQDGMAAVLETIGHEAITDKAQRALEWRGDDAHARASSTSSKSPISRYIARMVSASSQLMVSITSPRSS